MLRYALDFSTDEIAEVMEVSVQAVRNLQHRGLAFLRQRLKENDDRPLKGGCRMASVVILRPAPVITGRQEALRPPLAAAGGGRGRW